MATQNQKRAVLKTIENLRTTDKIDMGDILRQSGYSESVATHPKVVTESQGWIELLEQYLPDDLLLKKNLFLLKNKNWQAVNAGLDKAYKIKGKYKDKMDVNITDLTDELRKPKETN